MDIRQLQYLAALARERHFTRAAAACNVTQPTLSGRIRQLELELEVPIVERGQRYRGLTPEGERVLKWAHVILKDWQSMQEELGHLKDHDSGLTGRLVLGGIPSALPMIPLLTQKIRTTHPGIDFTVLSHSSEEILRGLADFSIDVGITYLDNEPIDGLLATPDVVEDLLLLGTLDDKIVIGSMNRGGLHGAVFEVDDRFTAFDASALHRAGYDGGKMLCRIDLSDPGTAPTLKACGHAVSQLAGYGLMAMVEPFWCRRVDGRLQNDLSPEAVIRSIHVAQALGVTSAHTWLKLPIIEDMACVMAATTLPTLLLGGDPSGSPDETYAGWRQGLRAPNVRGLVVGRALLYPPGGDVQAAVDAAAALVH